MDMGVGLSTSNGTKNKWQVVEEKGVWKVASTGALHASLRQWAKHLGVFQFIFQSAMC